MPRVECFQRTIRASQVARLPEVPDRRTRQEPALPVKSTVRKITDRL